ncbi:MULTISPECIES: YIP1 family protein [Paenibacillus]|uniref:YIP1 family protein n=1 Tax=Paenibacillus TaxID=44249 RepID=UPI000BA61D1E|nr:MULTISPECIES: YIP1 family protein [Paenibacillus]MBM6386669.1 YIP1 family protein [Paenibacillus sp.]MCG7384688.1 YIP1 family protein [Paenibacillus sp. ACRRY]PAD31773.1 YIP1 family protein [Paenibacillus sp. 7523-1]
MKQDYIKFPLHLIFHPIDAYWDLKSDNRGRMLVAFLALALTIIMMTLQKQYAGFLVNFTDPRTINSIVEIATVAVPFFLWCIANWSVTTLMEGEGKFREIFLATGYSLIPVILIYAPMIVISRFMVQEETAFYYLFNSIAFFWFLLLLFIGTMTVHQYTVFKTIITMLLTLIVMGIIVFLGALVFSMLQQLYEFGYNIYRELIFRT